MEQRELVLTMGTRWEKKTLQDFLEFQRSLETLMHFDPHDLQLLSAHMPCLQLVLGSMSESADIGSIRRVEPEVFKQNHVLRVALRTEVIFNVEWPRVRVYKCVHVSY